MLLCCFFRPRVVDDEPNEEQRLKKRKWFKKENKKKRGKLVEYLEKQVEVKQTNENEQKERKEVEEGAVEEVKAEKEQEVGEKEKNGMEEQLLLKEVSVELVEEVQMDLERVTEELKDEMSLKEEQVEEPVPADSLAGRRPLVHPLTSCLHNDAKEDLHLHLIATVDSTLKEEVKQVDMKRKWMERLRQREELKKLSGSTGKLLTDVSHTEKSDLVLNTIPANDVRKLEDKEAKAISSHLKNSGDAQNQDFELLLKKMKKKWAGKFSEMSAVRRPLVHPLTSCLHNDAPVDLHLHLNSTVDSTLKEELKQMDMKRKWMERLRQREELKKLSGSTGKLPTDVSHTEKSDLVLNTIPANDVRKLEDKEAKAISSHLKNSGDAQNQDFELLLKKMKKKWAGKFSEMSAVRRPLVHPLTSCLHNDAPVDLHLHLNSTVDSTLKEELKQMDMKRKWMERLRQREELKKLSGSTGKLPTDVSHTEKSDLVLNTIPANDVRKLEDKEAKAISSHLKNSGDAQNQDFELLLKKMKKKWAGKFSEMSAVRRPLVHPLNSCLHNDAPVDLHLHLNSTVDSTLKEELKQMDMKRKWMERLRQREELKKLSGSTGNSQMDASHTEKSVQSQPQHPPQTTPVNV
ncbi:hypothetical protein AOLI_G00226490 [Acnodon oligacanthus]